MQDRCGARDVGRLPELFVVDEEERLAAAVEEPGITIGPPTRTPAGSASAFGFARPLRLLNQVFALSASLR